MKNLDPDEAVARITRLLATGQYTRVRGTLSGIAATIERTKRVTQGQYDAVERIIVWQVNHDHAVREAGIRVRGRR